MNQDLPAKIFFLIINCMNCQENRENPVRFPIVKLKMSNASFKDLKHSNWKEQLEINYNVNGKLPPLFDVMLDYSM